MQSCLVAGPGTSACGAGGESCCTSLEVPSGTFYRTYAEGDAGLTDEGAPASVSGFRLDKYLVTVGRFRAFVGAWTAGYRPSAGSGKHTHLRSGQGLVDAENPGLFESGWIESDDDFVTPTVDNLTSCSSGTYSAAPAGRENLPMTCINGYEAQAFCIWDGGFLPSEAEWEYAAAGGSDQRPYPWGAAAPGTANQYAIFNCDYPNGPNPAFAGDGGGAQSSPWLAQRGTCNGVASIAPVGSVPAGAGRWGQLDLAGEDWEWTLDWLSPLSGTCTDCAQLSITSGRAVHGGPFDGDILDIQPTLRYGSAPSDRGSGLVTFGIRCARVP